MPRASLYWTAGRLQHSAGLPQFLSPAAAAHAALYAAGPHRRTRRLFVTGHEQFIGSRQHLYRDL